LNANGSGSGTLMNPRYVAIIPVGLALALSACGHSEEEWQAQLGKYRAEVVRADARHQENLELQKQLTTARDRVSELEQQLTAMGLTLDSKDQTVDQLSDNLAEVKRALDSYKARARALEAIRTRMLQLRARLEELTKIGLKVSVRKNRMVISLPGDVLFDTGRTELKPEGRRALEKVAETIRNDAQLTQRDFQVAGHTDARPFAGPPYLDNWGLSLMRARQVLLFLTTSQTPAARRPGERPEAGGGLPVQRWSAAGYADTDPVVPNDSAENMQRNRRVELVVLPNVEEMLDLRSLTEAEASPYEDSPYPVAPKNGPRTAPPAEPRTPKAAPAPAARPPAKAAPAPAGKPPAKAAPAPAGKPPAKAAPPPAPTPQPQPQKPPPMMPGSF